jgi:hypothetical protein
MSALQLVDLDEISGRFAMAGILYFSWIKFDNFVVADFNGMNTGRCIRQAPNTMLMIQVRSYNKTLVIEFPKENVWIPPLQLVNPFDQVIDFKEGHDLVTYNSNGWSICNKNGENYVKC